VCCISTLNPQQKMDQNWSNLQSMLNFGAKY